LYINAALLSETHLKHHERFLTPNYPFHWTDCFPGRKGGTAGAIRKGILQNHVDLPPLISIEAPGICIPIDNSDVLLVAVCESRGNYWNDADIAKLLNFRYKSLLAGDLNAKYPFWNNVFPIIPARNY
jgi:hypothetical protein